MFRQQESPVEPAENESRQEEDRTTHDEEHPKTLRQERSKRQREVLDDYPVEAFKRQSTAPA
eukprot:6635693-Karenia_brevis.AAC.1